MIPPVIVEFREDQRARCGVFGQVCSGRRAGMAAFLDLHYDGDIEVGRPIPCEVIYERDNFCVVRPIEESELLSVNVENAREEHMAPEPEPQRVDINIGLAIFYHRDGKYGEVSLRPFAPCTRQPARAITAQVIALMVSDGVIDSAPDMDIGWMGLCYAWKRDSAVSKVVQGYTYYVSLQEGLVPCSVFLRREALRAIVRHFNVRNIGMRDVRAVRHGWLKRDMVDRLLKSDISYVIALSSAPVPTLDEAEAIGLLVNIEAQPDSE